MRKEMISEGGEYIEPSLVERGEGERDHVLSTAVRAFQEFTSSAIPTDRPIAVEMRYYLQGIQRTGSPSLDDAVERLRERADNPDISLALQSLLRDSARRCASAAALIRASASSAQASPAETVMKQSGLTGDQSTLTPPRPAVQIVFSTKEERQMPLLALDTERNDHDQAGLRLQWEGAFGFARRIAAKSVEHYADLTAALAEHREALNQSNEGLRHDWDMDAVVIGADFSEEFYAAYLAARNRAGEDWHAFDSAVRDIIGIQCRIAAMQSALESSVAQAPSGAELRAPSASDQTPEQHLGVASAASREDIEDAFAQAMQDLDLENDSDRQRIAVIQSARERMLHRVERREQDAARLQKLREALGSAESSAPREIIPDAPVAGPAEGWWSKRLRTPGAKIRTLFAGALGLGAVSGAIALREFGVNESDPSHVVAGALENVPQEGVDGDRDKDTEGPGPAIVNQEAVPTTDFIVERRDTLWNELRHRITNRGLRVTDQKIFMLKHLADLENPTVDWDHLQVGQVIHLASVEHMLDEMEGKPVSAEPVQSFPPALAGGSPFASELENIPASSFSEEIARLNQPVDRAETSGTAKEKAYQGLPTVDHPVREIKKGEHIFKIVHGMLRASGLNWTTERINFLDAVVLEQNHMTEAQAARLPVGTPINFGDAAKIIAEMKADVAAGKKSKTVKQLKAARAKQK